MDLMEYWIIEFRILHSQ